MPNDVYLGVKLDDPTQAIERIASHGDTISKLSDQLDELERREARQTVAIEALKKRMAENVAELNALNAKYEAKLRATNARLAPRR